MLASDTQPLNPASVTWAFVAILVAIAPHSTRFSVWLMLALVLLGLWRVLGAYRVLPLPDRKYLPFWIIKQIIAVAIFIATYLSFDGQLGRDAGVAMLTALLGLKLLEMRKTRDFYIVMFLAYFLVVTNLFYSQTLATASYMCLVVVVVTAGLIHFNGAESDIRVSRCFKLAGLYSLQAVPVMVIAFILFPRIPGPLWGIPQDTTAGVTGLSDEMTIGNISRLGVSDEIAFRVSFADQEPPANELYWRGPVLWDTNGVTWRSEKPSSANTFSNDPLPLVPSNDNVRYDYQIIIEPHGEKWIFALDHAVRVSPSASVTRDYQVIASKSINRRARYELTSARQQPVSGITVSERQRALALPAGYHKQSRSLAESWLNPSDLGKPSPEAIINKALNFFNRENFIYTLTPKAVSADAVDSFLFETREGFCEYFASSFVILMRAVGIPARVVTGYQGGEYNTLSDFMAVRQRDAHAWAEVYLEDRGWVRVDPTAAVAPERVSLGVAEIFANRNAFRILADDNPLSMTWHGVRNLWGAMNFNWSRWVLGYSPIRQRQLLDELGFEDWNYGTLIIVLTLVMALALAVIAIAILKTSNANEDITQELYRKFCAKLASVGFHREVYEGPLDFAQRVAAANRELADDVSQITLLYIRLRYANNTQDIHMFAENVRQFINR